MRADDTRDLTPDELRVAVWTIRREGEMGFPFVVSARSIRDLEAELLGPPPYFFSGTAKVAFEEGQEP